MCYTTTMIEGEKVLFKYPNTRLYPGWFEAVYGYYMGFNMHKVYPLSGGRAFPYLEDIKCLPAAQRKIKC